MAGLRGNTGTPADFSSLSGVNSIVASETISDSNLGYLNEVNSGSSVTITIPNETTLPFTKPKIYVYLRKGTGQVLFAEEAGLTVYGGITEIADTETTTGGAVLITHVGPNEYYITGKEV